MRTYIIIIMIDIVLFQMRIMFFFYFRSWKTEAGTSLCKPARDGAPEQRTNDNDPHHHPGEELCNTPPRSAPAACCTTSSLKADLLLSLIRPICKLDDGVSVMTSFVVIYEEGEEEWAENTAPGLRIRVEEVWLSSSTD